MTASNPDQGNTTDTLKRCPDCGIGKPANQFNRDRARSDGLRSYCKLCDSKRSADYYLRESEKVIERMRGYREDNRELVLARRKAAYWRREAEKARGRVESTTHKRCLGCAETLPNSDFHLKGSVRKDGTPRRESRCRTCRNTRARASYRDNTASSEQTAQLSA